MNMPKGCADPDACACRERIAELERVNADLTDQLAFRSGRERAEERERLLAQAIDQIDRKLDHYRKTGNQMCIDSLEYIRCEILALGDE